MTFNLTDSEISKLDEKSETLFRELHADMRTIRETELKMVPLFFQVSAFTVAANILAATATVPKHYAVFVMVISLIFIFGFWIQLHLRINHDRETYYYLGQRARYIREQWGVAIFYKPAERKKLYGAGPGYRKNQKLVAWSALFVILIIAFGLATKLDWIS